MHRCGGKNVKNVCVGCQMVPSITAQNAEILIPISSKHPFLQKVRLILRNSLAQLINDTYTSTDYALNTFYFYLEIESYEDCASRLRMRQHLVVPQNEILDK